MGYLTFIMMFLKDLFVYFKSRVAQIEGEGQRYFPVTEFTPKMASVVWAGARMKPGASFLSSSLMWIGGPPSAAFLCCQQGNGLEVEQPGFESVCDTGIAGRGKTHCTTIPAPYYNSFLYVTCSITLLGRKHV